MQKQNFLFSFYRMFYSKEFYREVVSVWKSQVFWFFLIIIIISLIKISVNMIIEGNKFIKNQAPEIINKIPTMTIKNGIMEIDKKSPYAIEIEKESFAVFDMNDKYKTIGESKSRILVKPDRLIYKQNDLETREYSFRSIKSFTLNKEIIQNWLNMAPFMYFIIILSMIAGSLFFRYIQILINSFFGFIISLIVKAEIKYNSILKLSTVTACIGILISIIMDSFSFSFRFSWIVLFLISMVYLIFAIISNKTKTEPPGMVPENTEQPKAE